MDNEKTEKVIDLLKSLYLLTDSIIQTIENGVILYKVNFNNIKFEEKNLNINKNLILEEKEDSKLPINNDQKRHEDLLLLIDQIRNCNRCELSLKRISTVAGAGPINSQVMIIGEAPGEQEDVQGLPFVGRAGQLLTKLLNNADIKREEIYITNCVKCRPPNNRVPTINEMMTCSIYLKKQINLIKPKLIICLGATAIQFLLQKKVSISKIRGTLIESEVFGEKLMIYPTFHPSFLLRDNSNIPIAQNDFNKIAKYIKRNNLI